MKNKRHKWLINISTLALALCVMAFGVYAAKSASLSTSGSIGFISHDADVTVVGTITGAMRGKEYGFKQITQEADKTTTVLDEEGNATSTVWQDSFTTVGGGNGDYLVSGESWVFGDLYFDEMNVEEVEGQNLKITIKLEVTNYSDFNILVKVIDSTSEEDYNPTLNGISVKTTKALISANDGTTQDSDFVTITYTLTDKAAAETVGLSAINPRLKIERTDLTELPPEPVTTESGWTGYVTEDGKFEVTGAPTVQDGQTLTVPSTVNYDGQDLQVVLATDEDYDGYVKTENGESVYVITNVPESEEIEATASNALNARHVVKATTDSSSIYIPSYVLSNNVVYQTSVCSTTEGYTVNGTMLTGVPASNGQTEIVIPAVLKIDGEDVQLTSAVGSGYMGTIDNINTYKSVKITKGITRIENYAFYQCDNIESVVLPESIDCISDFAFVGCTSLSSVVIPASVKTIGHIAFSGCTSLNSIKFADNSQIESVSYNAFADCPAITFENGISYLKTASNKSVVLYQAIEDDLQNEIVVPDGCRVVCEYAFKNCENITSVTLPSSIVTIDREAFSTCKGLTTFTIPANVVKMGLYVFEYCDNLQNIYFEEGSAIKTINSCAFGYCKGLESIKLPSTVTTIEDYAFRDCKNLTSIEMPEGVTSIGTSAFSRCTNLKSISIPASVTCINDCTFYNCTGLETVTFANDCKLETIGNEAFYGCTSIVNIEILASITSIGNDVFRGCANLASIEIPASVTSIGSYVFYGCTNLAAVEFAEGITITSINNGVFRDCTSLTSIIIPASVTSIGSDSFNNCTSLKNVILNNTLASSTSSPLGLDTITYYAIPTGSAPTGSFIATNYLSTTNLVDYEEFGMEIPEGYTLYK